MHKTTVDYDDINEEYFIIIPDEVLKRAGFEEGDILEIETGEGALTLRKKSS